MKTILFLLTFLSCSPLSAETYNRTLASAVVMSASVNSSVADLQYMDDASVQFIWYSGSTPVGAINLQGSNQISTSGGTGVASWTDLSTAIYVGSTSLTGNSGSYLYNVPNAGFRWLRAVYTRTSGSGRLDINFSGKKN